MVRTAVIIVFSAAMAFGGPVLAKKSQRETHVQKQIMRSPDELMPLISVKGDALDPAITISTRGIISQKTKILWSKFENENSFLRAFVDKKTGVVSAQVYHQAVYGGSGWHFFTRATYEGLEGLTEVDLDRLGSDVNCASYGCTHYEDLAFTVPVEMIHLAASKYDPANPLYGLNYRLFGKSGQTIDEGIPINEITAFSRKIAEVKREMGFTDEPKKAAPSEAAQ
jgi:hypothetical protein